MNTVKIGDDFEIKSRGLIKQIINNEELSLNPAHCKVFEKKKYYSIKRRKEIIFDLSIEVKSPKADKPFLVCIIECKSLSKAMPVDDIEEFESKVGGIQGFQTKKIVIAKNGFSSGALETAKSLGITLIHFNEDDYDIVLYKPDRQEKKVIDTETEIENLIKKALLPKKIYGLKKLSRENIDKIAVSFLNEVDKGIVDFYKKTPIEKIISFLEVKRGIKTRYNNYLLDNNGNELLGYYDLKNKTIFINKSIANTIRFPFVFAHELGHYILHSNLKMHQLTYDNFKDSAYNLFHQSYKLKNEKHWIEWQANCFASCFLMPKTTLMTRLISIQMAMGISKQGTIFIDHQPINKKDYREIIKALSTFFEISKVSVEYRLNSLNIIKYPKLSEEEKKERDFLKRLADINSRFNS